MTVTISCEFPTIQDAVDFVYRGYATAPVDLITTATGDTSMYFVDLPNGTMINANRIETITVDDNHNYTARVTIKSTSTATVLPFATRDEADKWRHEFIKKCNNLR